jgi:hypothetical protein
MKSSAMGALLLFGVRSLSGGIVDTADAIVIGSLTAGQQIGSEATVSISVQRVLKGNLLPGQVANAELDSVVPAKTTIQLSGHFGVWFLQTGSAGWRVLAANPGQSLTDFGRAYYSLPDGSVPATTSGAAPQGAVASPYDLLALELSPAVEGLSSQSVQFLDTAMGFLALPVTPTVIAQYQRLKMSAQPHARVVGLVGLLRQGDLASLAQLLDPPDAALKSSSIRGEVLKAVRGLRIESVPIVLALGKLATLPTVPAGVQAAAEYALRAIHTQDSLPFLADMLDSSSADIRDDGIQGLSMFVENLPVQTSDMIPGFSWAKPRGPAPYKTPETEKHSAVGRVSTEQQPAYVAYWRSWWQEIGTRLEQ